MRVVLVTLRSRRPGAERTERAMLWDDGVIEGDETVVRALDAVDGPEDRLARALEADGRTLGYSHLIADEVDLPPDDREPIMGTGSGRDRGRDDQPVLRQLPALVRAVPDAPAGTVEARVAAYGVEYPIFPGVRERIEPGAFADSIGRQRALPFFYEHDWSSGPIGNSTSISDDDDSLVMQGSLYIDDDSRARSVWRALDAGALREWSIGFWPEAITREERRDDDGDLTIESVTRGDLAEASVVVRGANPDTDTLSVRTRRLSDAERAAIEDAFSGEEDWRLRLNPERFDAAMRIPALREVLREGA